MCNFSNYSGRDQTEHTHNKIKNTKLNTHTHTITLSTHKTHNQMTKIEKSFLFFGSISVKFCGGTNLVKILLGLIAIGSYFLEEEEKWGSYCLLL